MTYRTCGEEILIHRFFKISSKAFCCSRVRGCNCSRFEFGLLRLRVELNSVSGSGRSSTSSGSWPPSSAPPSLFSFVRIWVDKTEPFLLFLPNQSWGCIHWIEVGSLPWVIPRALQEALHSSVRRPAWRIRCPRERVYHRFAYWRARTVHFHPWWWEDMDHTLKFPYQAFLCDACGMSRTNGCLLRRCHVNACRSSLPSYLYSCLFKYFSSMDRPHRCWGYPHFLEQFGQVEEKAWGW